MASVVKQRGSRRGITYRVDFRDHSKVFSFRSFDYKPAAEAVRTKVNRLEQLRGTGERPDADLMQWVNTLPAAWRARLERAELLDDRSIAAAKPLRDHVDDYHQALLDKGGTAKHAQLTKTRITAILDGTGATNLCDLDAAAVARYLADRREKTRKNGGLSVASSNHHLRALKSFCTWLVRERRTLESPVAHLAMMNADVDKQHERRALENEEMRWLLDVTRREPDRFGMTGAERATVYRLAVETGLRANELRSLRRSSFTLEGDELSVVVSAGYSKHRREDHLPLRTDTAGLMRGFLARKLPAALAFNLPGSDKTAMMLRADLEAARLAWIDDATTDVDRKRRESSAFLVYRDDAGRVADFHSLRHTFITNLARGGVHPKDAQALARHSTITLTMDRYSHVSRRALGKALDALPDLSGPVRQSMRATGTDDATASLGSAQRNAQHARGFQRHSVAPNGTSNGSVSAVSDDYEGAQTPSTQAENAMVKGNAPTGPSRTRTCDQRIMSPPL